jgi:hypothetical protein
MKLVGNMSTYVAVCCRGEVQYGSLWGLHFVAMPDVEENEVVRHDLHFCVCMLQGRGAVWQQPVEQRPQGGL